MEMFSRGVLGLMLFVIVDVSDWVGCWIVEWFVIGWEFSSCLVCLLWFYLLLLFGFEIVLVYISMSVLLFCGWCVLSVQQCGLVPSWWGVCGC